MARPFGGVFSTFGRTTSWGMLIVAASVLLRNSPCQMVAAWTTTTTTAVVTRGGRSTVALSRLGRLHSPLEQRRSFGAWARTGVLLEAKKQAKAEDSKKGETKTKKKTNPKDAAAPAVRPVPITLLSGFLGTGKTSALQHLLQNTENYKIGVIVNDVAAVNIDAKVVMNNQQTTLSDNLLKEGMVMELQNGCACCSLADELFMSVDNLMKGRELDAIVVELSGVADPMAIKNNWIMSPEFVQAKAQIARVVTVLDAASFGTDYMSWDEARERRGWLAAGEDLTSAGNRKVAELLAEQVEAADLILLNKIDLADNEEQVLVAEKVAKALNEKADIRRVTFGTISPSLVLGKLKNEAELHEEDCHEPGCTDPSHSHSHAHHEHDHAKSHDDHHHDAAACADPVCTDPSHSHSHDHTEASAASCEDATCTDPTHSHSHSHNDHATSVDQLGLVNFVYRSDRPFNPVRLMNVLNRWPVPIKDTLNIEALTEAVSDGYEINGQLVRDSPFVGVIRSKGFCWFAPSKWTGSNTDAWRHDTAMYWSHAGKCFTINSAGKWWGTLTPPQMKQYFVFNEAEYERILKEDFVSTEFGDRRQEIVFIGVDLDQDKITATLNECLLTDKEMEKYRQQWRNYQDSIVSVKSSRSFGLFNVDGMDHTDG